MIFNCFDKITKEHTPLLRISNVFINLLILMMIPTWGGLLFSNSKMIAVTDGSVIGCEAKKPFTFSIEGAGSEITISAVMFKKKKKKLLFF